VVETGETCDDEGLEPGDGCNASCAQESGWSCDGADPTACGEICGDSLLVGLEVEAAGCDDGRQDDGDGCDASCRVEPGWFCSQEPSVCAETCGNEVIDGAEECDDGDLDSDDGCHACVVVDGWECDGQPSVCADVDECDLGTHDCDENATCTNADGGFTCACDEPAYEGNGTTCTDVDECDEGLDDCDENATCENEDGGFTCTCNPGFAGSGTSCMAVVASLGVGADHTCAVIGSGRLRCWGEGQFGQLGYGNTSDIGDTETPASAGDVNVGALVRQVDGGLGHSCALLTTGGVRCWGAGDGGRLGYGNVESVGLNQSIASAGDVPLGDTAVQIAVGNAHSCAVLTNGGVRCWGANTSGCLGYGNTEPVGDDETPASVPVVNVGGSVRQTAVGSVHTCALLTTGAVRCWGDGQYGKL
jgi:cysteine-rich repeat protein